jgi:hypothetical protein
VTDAKRPGEVTFDLIPLKGEIPERASRKTDKELRASLESFGEERDEWDEPTAQIPVAATKFTYSSNQETPRLDSDGEEGQ